MSRDLTPQELFLIDYQGHNKLRAATLEFVGEDGTKQRLDNHLAKDRYPELSFLYNGFDELYKKHSSDEKVLAVLDKLEEAIVGVEQETLNGELPFTTPFDETVRKWFNGELDEHFYYNDENDRLFEEFVKGEVAKEAKEAARGFGTIVVLAGASGSGKDTLRNALVELGYERLVTYTTRSPREGEQDGVDYHFVSPEWFKSKIEDGSMFEYRKYESATGDKYYGSMKQELDSTKSYVIVLDDTGVQDYQKAYGQENIFAVLVDVDEHIRYERAFAREFPEERLKALEQDPALYEQKVAEFDMEWDNRKKNDNARFGADFRRNVINFKLDNEYQLEDVVAALRQAQGTYEGADREFGRVVIEETIEFGKLTYAPAHPANRKRQMQQDKTDD